MISQRYGRGEAGHGIEQRRHAEVQHKQGTYRIIDVDRPWMPTTSAPLVTGMPVPRLKGNASKPPRRVKNKGDYIGFVTQKGTSQRG